MHAHVLGGAPLGPMLRPMTAPAARYERLVRQAQARRPDPGALGRRCTAPTVHCGRFRSARRHRRPLTPQPFRIGSVTKTFTAVLVHAVPRRRPARPRRPARQAPRRARRTATLTDPPAAVAHRRPAARAVRRRLGHPASRPDAERPARRPRPGRAGAAARPPVPLLEPRRSRCSASWSAGCAAAPGREVLDRADPAPAGPGRDHRRARPAEAATGYLVDAYSDHARPEPPLDFRAVGPAAQLWSTAADMARWAAFLADPAAVDPGGAVLARRHAGRDALAAHRHRRDSAGRPASASG